MNKATINVFLRRVPEKFCTGRYRFSRNNIYNEGGQLVGQLEEAEKLDVQVSDAIRLLGGKAAISNVANVASILNLGVSVVGFMHISKNLKQVQRRLDKIEGKLDTSHEMLGVIDQKIDQLSLLAQSQIHALVDLKDYIESTQMAKVYQALETIEFRMGVGPVERSDSDVISAIEMLQQYRVWLSQQRNNQKTSIPIRAEIMRAEVLISMAEARARCATHDATFAARFLEASVSDMHGQVNGMWESVVNNYGIQSIFACGEIEASEWVDIHSWLHGVDARTSASQILREMAESIKGVNLQRTLEASVQEASLSTKRGVLQMQLQVAMGFDFMIKGGGVFGGYTEMGFKIDEDKLRAIQKLLADYEKDELVQEIRAALDHHETTRLVEAEDEGGLMCRIDAIFERFDECETARAISPRDTENEQADVASVALCYRFARNLEAALTVCAANELAGDTVGRLLPKIDESDGSTVVFQLEYDSDIHSIAEYLNLVSVQGE